MFWWVIVIVAGFLILRSILRAAAPRHSGYGYGGFGGGGSFWSGLLGGLGGAWLGNELLRGEGEAPAKPDAGPAGDSARGGVGGGSGDGDGGW
jgi:hypothetical protein